MRKVIPILRIFDVQKAKEFYLSYLGFHLDWEHRFEEGMPLYAQITRDEITLHLSEHHGDCTPGAAVRIGMDQLEAYWEQLKKKNYTYLRPGLTETPWNIRELNLTDPFGNRIIFYENI